MVARVVDEFGGVDILVNAAATPNRGGFGEETLEAEINVKVRGYLRCARAVAPLMAAQGWGRIVNISGLAARQTGSVVGSVRNVAVAAMTKNLADELGPSGINVTVVHPGLTITEREPPPDVPPVDRPARDGRRGRPRGRLPVQLAERRRERRRDRRRRRHARSDLLLGLGRRADQQLVDRHPPRLRHRGRDRRGDVVRGELLHTVEEVVLVVLDLRPHARQRRPSRRARA